MNIEEKIKKIEALLNGTSSQGEKEAAELAIQRLRSSSDQRFLEYTVRTDSHWKKRLLLAVCSKYQIQAYRYSGQRHTTVVVRSSRAFMKEVLWPEFKKYERIFESFAKEIMTDLIEKIHDTVQEEIIVAGELTMAEAVL